VVSQSPGKREPSFDYQLWQGGCIFPAVTGRATTLSASTAGKTSHRETRLPKTLKVLPLIRTT